MNQTFEHVEKINNELSLPGDKSISHRAVMFASLADGISIIKNCSNSEDVRSTINCFSQLGCSFEEIGDKIRITGKGFKGFSKPREVLYAGNSGTTSRLISGILAVQDFESIITGDESLSLRPMKRIIEPLRLMGAKISAAENGSLPIIIKPSNELHSIKYTLKVASAQVKSALLLCAIHMNEESIISEDGDTRNHTEMLLNLKIEKTIKGKSIYASRMNYPEPFQLNIPSDISSAAFFIVLTLLTKNSELIIKNISLNETRTGILNVLKEMGANIDVYNVGIEKGENVGDITIRSSKLKNIKIPTKLIPNIIDEIPILSIAGVFSEGVFEIRGAKELRIKESDRIKSLCSNFTKLGLKVVEYDDGFSVDGSIENQLFEFESYGDHRIAMAFSIMCMLLKKGGTINNFECVGISNPNFIAQLKAISITG
jgi:3-phosphoshikimate 1-carboxyvinyltransferase